MTAFALLAIALCSMKTRVCLAELGIDTRATRSPDRDRRLREQEAKAADPALRIALEGA